MKKVGIIILFVLIFLTGCSNYNNSPDKLAKEMVTRLSKGNYENIDELILTDENTLITSSSFKNYLKENNLFIEGNELIEIVDYEKPSSKEDSNYVTVKIDNNKAIDIKTVKKDGKWFVKLDDYLYDEIEFLVPTNSSVKMDGKKLDSKKYSSTEEAYITLSYTSKTANPIMDKYKIKVFNDSKYDLLVTKNGFEDYKMTIDDNTTGSKNSGVRDSNNKFMVILKVKSSEKNKIEEFVKEYYDALFNSINSNGKIEDINKYIDSNNLNDFIKENSSYYNNKIKALKEENSYSREIYDNYTYKNIDYYEDGIYYLDDNNIFVVGKLNYSYHYKFEYFGMMQSFADTNNKDEIKTKDNKVSILLSKKKSNYKIKTGYNLVP